MWEEHICVMYAQTRVIICLSPVLMHMWIIWLDALKMISV